MDNIATQCKILIDTTEKKIEALNEILNISFNQELLLEQKMFNIPEFGEMVDEKQKRIDIVNDLDQTFINIYEKINTVVLQTLPQYSKLIGSLQEKVYKASDLEIKIKIQEQKNQLFAQGPSVASIENNKTTLANAVKIYNKHKR